jgi:hypothetical protein
MARGISIHIGLNNIDPAYYGTGNELAGCINDARDMQSLGVAQGFQTTLMTDEGATAEAVIAAISGAANTLRAGDILLLTYSGHGSQVPDKNGDEPDGKDETWCLYDRMLIDDELYSLWSQFQSGVRICVLSDSCHSGSVVRAQQTRELMGSSSFNGEFRNLVMPAADRKVTRLVQKRSAPPPARPTAGYAGAPPPSTSAAASISTSAPVDVSRVKFRFLPPEAAIGAYEKGKSLYDSVQRVIGRNAKEAVQASVILISGCQDNQLSADGASNGLFTEKLKEVWQDGGFSGDYPGFHKAVAAKMPISQSPNYFKAGAGDSVFEKQRPFTVTTDATNQPVASTLWVTGPTSMSRSDPAPTFTVNPGPNNYFVFEIATDASLFDTGNARNRRNDQNFYGSWSDSPHFSGTQYTLPDTVWDRLKSADALYYRIGSTATKEGWTDYMVSTPDQQYANAPSISLSGAAAGAGTGAPGQVQTGTPRITGPASIAKGDPAPSFTIDTAGAPYFVVEVATEAGLLDGNVPDSERTDDKFYATWQDSDLQTGSTYDLPDEVWQRLQPSDALYYRIGTTTSQTGWENYTLSTEDSDVANAPHIQVGTREVQAMPGYGVSRTAH